jgi:molybdopterin-guanine dinucleotide biosynthesis protein A
MCSAAILAGGAATRFGGRDKALLEVGGRSILDRQLEALAPVARDMVIVVHGPGRAAAYAGRGVPVVVDAWPGTSSLGGIYTAVTAAREPRTLVVACDMPFLSTAFLAYLAGVAPDADVTIPRSADGLQPLCACYSHRCAGPIRRRLEAGALKVADMLAELQVREIGPPELVPFDPDGRLFFNVNTPDDHRRANDLVEMRDR